MCVVSMAGDYWAGTFPKRYPDWVDDAKTINVPSFVSRQEFEALRQEIVELRKLLEAAKRFDEATGQHECHNDDKVKMIKAAAKAVGIDLKGVLD